MLSDSYKIMAEKQTEIAKKAKCYKICCYHLNKALKVRDFDDFILNEKQTELQSSIHKAFSPSTAESDFICEAYVGLFNNINNKMDGLKKYVGN